MSERQCANISLVCTISTDELWTKKTATCTDRWNLFLASMHRNSKRTQKSPRTYVAREIGCRLETCRRSLIDDLIFHDLFEL